jgi:hypothetical protein
VMENGPIQVKTKFPVRLSTRQFIQLIGNPCCICHDLPFLHAVIITLWWVARLWALYPTLPPLRCCGSGA